MYEGQCGAARHSVRGEVPHADRNRVVLIEVFHSDEPEKLVRNNGATQRAAKLFAREARGRKPSVESCRQTLQILVAEKDVLRAMDIFSPWFCCPLYDALREPPPFSTNL